MTSSTIYWESWVNLSVICQTKTILKTINLLADLFICQIFMQSLDPRQTLSPPNFPAYDMLQ